MNKITHIYKVFSFFLLFFIYNLSINSSLYAQGPNAPEASSFEPVDATDMVSLLTGDMTYVVPLLNVPSPEGGYPLALSYHAGIAVDQEASWVGLGWSLNPGTINRNVNGYPDDWKDALVKEFAYDEGGSISSTSISIGVGVPGEWSVGVGASWGSNRSFGGSISVGVAGFYGSIGTNGVSAGVGLNDQIGVSASVGFNGYVGVGADVGLSKNSDSSISLGIGYGPGGLSGDIGFSQDSRGADGKVMKGFSSGIGISLSSSGLGISGRVQGLGTSASVSFNSSIAASDYNVINKETGFILLSPFGYFSFGKNSMSWSLLSINNHTIDGSIYTYDINSSNFIDSGSLSDSKVKVKDEAHNDTFELDTDRIFEQNRKASYVSSNNGVFSNLDNYNVTAQGISGSIAPMFINNVRMVPFVQTELQELFSSGGRLAVGYGDGYFKPIIANTFVKVKPIQFNFCNSSNSYLKVTPFEMSLVGSRVEFSNPTSPVALPNGYSYSQDQSLIYHNSSYKEAENRKRDGQYIEYFTVAEINSGFAASKGFLDVENNFVRDLSSCGYVNSNSAKIDSNFDAGIGGFKITAADGKIYHYSLGVYQAELVRRLYGIVDNKTENQAHMDRMNVNPYATHWLLTAITGPDYVKSDVNRKYPDEGDYGYWVRFDYGKWSDGYIWKTPAKSVDIFNKVKEYSWGRKQIYYLDKIKTRTHTALFIKNLRDDNKSNAMAYKNMYHYRTSATNFMNVQADPLLKLEKIILLKNVDANSINKVRSPLISVKNYSYYLAGKFNSDFNHTELWSQIDAYHRQYSVNNSANVLDVNDLSGLNLESKALKVIVFNHNHNLAKRGASYNSDSGKLTLNSINFKGKQGANVLPPIKFSYGSNYDYTLSTKNDFGYYVNQPQAWSLNNIITPTGASIDITYEPDSYGKVAIKNGRVFTSKLKFTFMTEPPRGSGDDITSMQNAPKGTTRIKIEIDNQDPAASGIKFADHFDPTKTFFMDMWYSAIYNHPSSGYDRSAVNIDKADATIIELNTILNYMIVEVEASSPAFRDVFQHSAEPVSALYATNSYAGIKNVNLPRFELAWNGTKGHRQYSMRHTIIGNKIKPENNCGIRVKQITVNDNVGKKYNTYYDYNNPLTGKTSGIIPYYPEPDYAVTQQAPYISLLPGPVVTYEYVTESSNVIKKQYKFKVLEEITESNNLISFGDLLQINKSEEKPNGISLKNVTVKNNLQSLGRIEEIKVLNAKDQIIKQTKNNYAPIDDYFSLGQSQQSYYAYKEIWQWGQNGYHYPYSSVSSMIDISSTLKSTTTKQGGYTNTTYFDKYDFLTGQVLETRTVSSDGQSFKTKIVPAYNIGQYNNPSGGYGMGSKVDNPTNRNMLSQTAAEYSYILDKGTNTWKETGVGITTWSNIWSYKDITGAVTTPTAANEKIWRKHKTFVWNGVKDSNGIFTNYSSTTDDGFNWTVGVGSQPAQWKQVSETTLYDHFSAALEMKDINGNLASTKMGDNDTKVMVSGNAGYNEIFYTGIENSKDIFGINWLEPEIKIENATRITNSFHTGKYCVSTTSSSQFGVVMGAPINNIPQHRPGKYKVSIWVRIDNAAKAQLKVNGTLVSFVNDNIIAGNWQLKTAYITVPEGACTVYLNSSDTSIVYYDDLMIRPVASTITGYAYNEWDELTHIIGNNGLATRFEYDAAGRLIKTYTEVIDDPANSVTGGFKLMKSYTMNNRYMYQ